MVKSSKLLTRKVAKFEKRQESKEKASATARKAVNKATTKLKSKDTKKEIKKIVISEDVDGEQSGLSADERKQIRIEKLKANVKAKKLGISSSVSLETAVAHAQASIAKKGGTSLNLKSAQRHDVFVSELNHFNRARAIPEFNADPFGTVEAHLIQTAPMLRKQTPESGRRVEKVGPVQRHAGYGAGSKK
eukprot:GILI01035822.1.p1 GENE.GILI01035822.1~~GILI01035822.1.p1  ORF type:complete len:190 (+),score=44.75 GILI01035822.1:54-623(+)